MRQPDEFDRTARNWTRMYAGGTLAAPAASISAPAQPKEEPLPPGISKDAVKRLCDMGFDREDVVRALVKGNGREDVAVESLLSGM